MSETAYSYADLRAHGKSVLGKDKVLDMELILAHVFSVTREQLFIQEPGATEQDFRKYEALLLERKSGKPLAYIIGSKEFYGRTFMVNEHSLIPRPDSEVIVEVVKGCYESVILRDSKVVSRQAQTTEMSSRGHSSDDEGQLDSNLHFHNGSRRGKASLTMTELSKPAILDLGSGSGALGLTLAAELPEAQVMLSDVSFDALQVAEKNRLALKLQNVELVQSDLLIDIPAVPEIIVANLPYIGTESHDFVEPEVKKYEPELALFSGKDGLDHYRELADQLDYLLRSQKLALLIMECHPQQMKEMETIFSPYFSSYLCYIIPDLSQTDRLFVLSREPLPPIPFHHVREIGRDSSGDAKN